MAKVGGKKPRTQVYTRNITHNLAIMATNAGLFQVLWTPEEIGISKAQDLVEPLRTGLETLASDRARFEKLNPKNGWGRYETLVAFVTDYLEACEMYPHANVRVSR
jgi:hypothetical protein